MWRSRRHTERESLIERAVVRALRTADGPLTRAELLRATGLSEVMIDAATVSLDAAARITPMQRIRARHTNRGLVREVDRVFALASEAL